jgi:hypothetical protein
MNFDAVTPAAPVIDYLHFIDETAEFLTQYDFLLQPSLTKFFVEDSFQCLPKEWQSLTSESIETLIEMSSLHKTNSNFHPTVIEFIKNAARLRIDRVHKCKNYSKVDEKLTVGMNPLKILQVKDYAGLINEYATDISHIIDMGSGQGYLDQVLAYQYEKIVIAIDDDKIQTEGAINHSLQIQKLKQYKHLNSNLYHIQERIRATDELKDIIKKIPQNVMVDEHSKWLLCGLHTCGDLAAFLLKLFIRSDANILINIGCCYNHLTEANHTKSTYHHDASLDPVDDISSVLNTIKIEEEEVAFPLSNYLKSKSISLGYMSRMLAAQTPQNWKSNDPESILLFRDRSWRAMIQKLLVTHYNGKINPDCIPVGRLPKKAFKNGFLGYVQHAIKKLKLEYPIESLNDEVVLEFEKEYEPRMKEMIVFWCLKVLMAESIESLILVDRLLYLWESGTCKSVLLEPVFSTGVSPRNMAIIALKK